MYPFKITSTQSQVGAVIITRFRKKLKEQSTQYTGELQGETQPCNRQESTKEDQDNYGLYNRDII